MGWYYYSYLQVSFKKSFSFHFENSIFAPLQQMAPQATAWFAYANNAYAYDYPARGRGHNLTIKVLFEIKCYISINCQI